MPSDQIQSERSCMDFIITYITNIHENTVVKSSHNTDEHCQTTNIKHETHTIHDCYSFKTNITRAIQMATISYPLVKIELFSVPISYNTAPPSTTFKTILKCNVNTEISKVNTGPTSMTIDIWLYEIYPKSFEIARHGTCYISKTNPIDTNNSITLQSANSDEPLPNHSNGDDKLSITSAVLKLKKSFTSLLSTSHRLPPLLGLEKYHKPHTESCAFDHVGNDVVSISSCCSTVSDNVSSDFSDINDYNEDDDFNCNRTVVKCSSGIEPSTITTTTYPKTTENRSTLKPNYHCHVDLDGTLHIFSYKNADNSQHVTPHANDHEACLNKYFYICY